MNEKVLEKLKGSPDSAWTPTQTAGHMELEDADAKVFAQIYEKARYAGTSCTKEEMEKMLRIRYNSCGAEKAESTVNFQLFLFMAYFLCTSVVQSCVHVHYGM